MTGVEDQAEPRVRIRVGALFDGRAFQDQPATVTVENGVITDVVRGVRRKVDLDFEDAVALPGLIDSHAHLGLPGDGRAYEEVAEESDGYMTAVGVLNALRHVSAGVTTIRDNGSRSNTVFDARTALERDPVPTPWVLVSGPPITSTGGHFWWCGGEAEGIDAIARRVREVVKCGADHVKIMASGGGTRGTDPGRASYTVEEIRSAVDTAHRLGRLITAHCRSTDSIGLAVSAGVDSVEHAEFLTEAGDIRLDKDVAQVLVDRSPWICPTLQASGAHELRRLRRERGPAWRQKRAALTKELNARIRSFGQLIKLGARDRIVFGTDAGPFHSPFGDVATELGLLEEAGLEPIECLRAATSRAATAIGIADRCGRIAEGLLADILVVSGSPLKDLGTIRAPEAVLQAGRIVGNRRSDGRSWRASGRSGRVVQPNRSS